MKSEKAAMVGGEGKLERVKTFIVHHAKSNILPRYFGQPLLIRMFEGIKSKLWHWESETDQLLIFSPMSNLHLSTYFISSLSARVNSIVP